MFGVVDVIIFCTITFLITMFVCLFMSGASIHNREEEAYQEGYADGKKVGGENDILRESKNN